MRHVYRNREVRIAHNCWKKGSSPYPGWRSDGSFPVALFSQEAAKKGAAAREHMVKHYSIDAMGDVLVEQLKRVHGVLEAQGKMDKIREELLTEEL